MNVEIDINYLCWRPKTVIFNGKEYPAPLNLLPLLTYNCLIELLNERRENYES